MSLATDEERKPLTSEQHARAHSHWAHVHAAKDIGLLGGLKARHERASGLARRMGESELSPAEREAAEREFKEVVTLAVLFPIALVSAVIGAVAIYFSKRHPPGDPCPLPLSKVLFGEGCAYLANAVILLLIPCLPTVYLLQPLLQSIIQAICLVLVIFVLMSYGVAERCGAELWWSSLFLSNALLGVFVWFFCSPVGLVKGTALLFSAKSSATTAAVAFQPHWGSAAVGLKPAAAAKAAASGHAAAAQV